MNVQNDKYDIQFHKNISARGKAKESTSNVFIL